MVSLLPSSSMSLPHAFPLSSSFVFAQQKCSFHWHPATATAMWSCMEISCFLIDMFVLPKPFLILKGIYQLCFWTMMTVSFWFLPVEQSQSVPHISCATKNQDRSFFFFFFIKEILTCVGCLQLTNKATMSFHFLNCLSNLGLGEEGAEPCWHSGERWCILNRFAANTESQTAMHSYICIYGKSRIKN